MAEYITAIRTDDGDKQIDYNYLANKPESDKTLSKSGAFADAKAVGDAIKRANETINNLTPSDVGAVPSDRTVNGKPLNNDVTLSAADVSAVPVTRKVNGKELSTDITLSAADVGASESGHTHNYAGSDSAGGKANSAKSADKLTNSRTILTNLGSTSSASFNGESDVKPGVTGVLPVTNGGTGANSVAGAVANLGLTPYYASARSTVESLTLPATEIIPLTLDKFISCSSNDFEFVDGGIRMPKAGTILVSGSVYIYGSDSLSGVYIKRNDDEVTAILIPNLANTSPAPAPAIINVVAGDVIKLCARDRNGSSCMPSNALTHLDVVYLSYSQ